MRDIGPPLTLDAIVAYLQRSWWHDFIDRLFEQGLAHLDRNFCRKEWKWLSKEEQICRARSTARKTLSSMIATCTLSPSG